MSAVHEMMVDEARSATASAYADADHRGPNAMPEKEIRQRFDELLNQETGVGAAAGRNLDQYRHLLKNADRTSFTKAELG